MTERITADELREASETALAEIKGLVYVGPVATAIIESMANLAMRLAKQMESDEERIDKFKDSHAAWGERYFTVKLERDALAAKVAEYEKKLRQIINDGVPSTPNPDFEHVYDECEACERKVGIAESAIDKEDTP